MSRRDFLRCYETGRRLFSRSFVLFAAPREARELPWRLGLAVTRKTGSAVWRNRVRRLLREAVRVNHTLAPEGYDLVIVPKHSLNPRRLSLSLVEGELLPLLRGLSERRAAAPTRRTDKSGRAAESGGATA